MFVYPPEFLESLATFGLAPTPATPPSLTRGALNDLYRVELRLLRQRLLRGEVVRDRYHDAVVAVRRRYWLLTLPLVAWERICAGLPPERRAGEHHGTAGAETDRSDPLSQAVPGPSEDPSSGCAE